MPTLLNKCKTIRKSIKTTNSLRRKSTAYYIDSSPAGYNRTQIIPARESAIGTNSKIELLIPEFANNSSVLPFYQTAYNDNKSFLLDTQFIVDDFQIH